MAELGLEARPAYQNPLSNMLGRKVGQETACGPALMVWEPRVAIVHIGGTDVEAETPVLWPPDVES